MTRLPEARSRIRTDHSIRAQVTIPDDSPCAHLGIGGDNYCSGPIMAEFITSPVWGQTATAETVETLCSNHHHLKALHRYQHAFIRDQEEMLMHRR